MLNPKFYKLSWSAVAGEVNRYADKPYSVGYIRNVAHNYQSNRQLTRLLTQLGVIQQIQTLKQRVEQ